MKILVTGGAGFIGSNFIRYWLKNNPSDSIINLDKLTYAGNLSSTIDFSQNPNYNFIKGDICNSKLVNSLMKGVDLVVHFAAETHVDRSLTQAPKFINTNIIGTQVLLQAAMDNHVRHFHHVSTDEVFGALDLNSGESFNESTQIKPRSPYSASKASSDHFVYAYFASFGLPVTISNCSNNYGPYQDPEKFITRMITNIISDKNIPIYGDGLYVRDWLHVDDHCRAIASIISKGKKGETYCIGGMTENVNNLQIAKIILQEFNLGENRLEFVKDRPGHDRRYSVDWSKIKNNLGWQPKINLKQGLQQTTEWYKNNSSWWKPIKKRAESIYAK